MGWGCQSLTYFNFNVFYLTHKATSFEANDDDHLAGPWFSISGVEKLWLWSISKYVNSSYSLFAPLNEWLKIKKKKLLCYLDEILGMCLCFISFQLFKSFHSNLKTGFRFDDRSHLSLKKIPNSSILYHHHHLINFHHKILSRLLKNTPYPSSLDFESKNEIKIWACIF